MSIERIALRKVLSDDDCGTVQSVYKVVDGDLAGVVVFKYEFDDREIVSEQLYADPAVADLVKNTIPSEGPLGLAVYSQESDSFGDDSLIDSAVERATSIVYENVWD